MENAFVFLWSRSFWTNTIVSFFLQWWLILLIQCLLINFSPAPAFLSWSLIASRSSLYNRSRSAVFLTHTLLLWQLFSFHIGNLNRACPVPAYKQKSLRYCSKYRESWVLYTVGVTKWLTHSFNDVRQTLRSRNPFVSAATKHRLVQNTVCN